MRTSEFTTIGTERVEKITCECGHEWESGCHIAVFELFGQDVKSGSQCKKCGKYE